MPANIETYKEQCSKETSPSEFAATVSALISIHQGKMNWIQAVSLRKDTAQLLDASTVGNCTPLPLCNILQAEKEDPNIARIIAYKEQLSWHTSQDPHGESAEVKALMHEWSKLMIGNGGALYRMTASTL